MDLTAVARVVIAHNPVGDEADPSTSDVLAQVALVAAGLDALGLPHQTVAVPDWRPWLPLAPLNGPGTTVFNLMEAPPGRPGALLGAAAALELMGYPFTGSAPGVLWVTTDKLATRAVLAAEGLPVAPGGRLDPDCPKLLDHIPGPWILKPACEDASLGLEGDPVCSTPEAAVARARQLAARFPGQTVVAETFLPGRELNVSLLALEGGDAGVEVLPIAEILYEDFPEGMSRVLGYEAKWDEGSFACTHTVRHFLDDPADKALLARAGELSRAAWRLFGLKGYARVDLRLDAAGEPCILEVNANPCLAADAGFMASAQRAGLSARDVIERILKDAVLPAPATAASPLQEKTTGDRPSPAITVRRDLQVADRGPVEELIRATGFFNAEEIEVALELVDDRLTQGEASHYRFLVGDVDGEVAGYACWGPIPGSQESADLYWIVVHPRFQGRGVGAALLRAAEDWMAAAGRPRVYVETSTRPQYDPTRAFYAACGYHLAAELPDFYAPGDGKAVFLRVI
ncbi:MAG TPA: GNAT family N-acetyltransferase [Thermoanaerobaculia bacterium]|nr:GNAT family N-acetyltransferase [Thermoanaerobaculia bacterium]